MPAAPDEPGAQPLNDVLCHATFAPAGASVAPAGHNGWPSRGSVRVFQEFKDFISRGGIFEAAVGLIMALAFVPVVGSLIADVIMPVVAAIVGQPDFRALKIDIGDAAITYGNFLTEIVTFVIIGFVMFLLMKAYNKMSRKVEEEEGPSEIDLLTEIRDSLANR